jgi:hypothetical protein
MLHRWLMLVSTSSIPIEAEKIMRTGTNRCLNIMVIMAFLGPLVGVVCYSLWKSPPATLASIEGNWWDDPVVSQVKELDPNPVRHGTCLF